MDKKMKINCKETRKLIQQEIDNRITDKNRELINMHLETCLDCTGEKEKLLKLHRLFQDNFANIEIPQLSNKFNRKFYRKLEERTTDTLWEKIKEKLLIPSRVIFEPRLAAAAVVAILLLAVISINRYTHLISGKKKVEDRTVTNSIALYNTAREKGTKRELRGLANRQAKEIIVIAGIRG